MRSIHFDFETRSPLEINGVGSWRYAREPRTEIICLAWAVGDDPVEVWTPEELFPIALLHALAFGGPVEAHNSSFERHIWNEIGIPRHGFPSISANRWRCSMARAAARGLPQSLEGLAKALGLSETKDLEGRKAMKRAALPLSNTKPGGLFNESELIFDKSPALIRKVCEYCRQDVDVERAASKLLPDLDERELLIWQLDQEINDRGIKIDRKLCSNAVRICRERAAELGLELFEVTKGAVGLPTELDRLKKWLRSIGIPVATLDEKTVSRLLEDSDIDDRARRALEIRQIAGRISVAKFAEMLRWADPADDRIRNNLRYHGAQTGRWAGMGVQIQNFPRGAIAQVDELADLFAAGDFEDLKLLFGDPISAAVSALRPSLIADEGKSLLVWDFAQIEARLLAWYAGCDQLVEAFRRGEDVYKLFAARAFGRELSKVSKSERFVGKTCILGLGYGMGAVKLHATFAAAGLDVSFETTKRFVDVYREGYPEIPTAWRKIENCAKKALSSSAPVPDRFGAFERSDRFLLYWLPAGRSIAYLDARIADEKIVYKKPLGKGLARAETYGGKLVENIIQATARDVMAEGMLRLKDRDFSLIATIHDEIIAEAPDATAQARLVEGKTLLEVRPKWCSAPLAVEGFVSRRYQK